MKQKNKKLKTLEVVQNHDFENANWICLFHGYGANAEDLYPLHRELDPEKKFNWIFPQAPLEVPLDLFSKGYAWWPIDIARYQQAVLQKDFSQVSQNCPQELTNLRNVFSDLLKEKQISWSRLILGGFSQGSMLATDISLHAETNPQALLLFSGTMICQEIWKSKSPLRKGTPFFQSHGSNDPVLSYGQAQRLYQTLKEAGLEGKMHTFSGGHEIPYDMIQKAAVFLKQF